MELKVTKLDKSDDGVATIWLDRPGRGNSWTNRMNFEYRWLMSSLDADPDVRVVVVTGSGRQFCVGADTQALDFYTGSEDEYTATVNRAENATPGYGVRSEFDNDLVWQWGLRLPVIAAINGACAGIAVALAGFCDLRYAAAGAKFTTATPRLGLPSEYGLSWLLPRIVGVAHAADILLTGRVVFAEELDRMGFLNQVLPADQVLARAYETAKLFAYEVSPAAVVAAKRQLYADLLRSDVGAAVEDSKELIGVYMQRPDFKEGVRAMAERRQPAFGPPGEHELPVLARQAAGTATDPVTGPGEEAGI